MTTHAELMDLLEESQAPSLDELNIKDPLAGRVVHATVTPSTPIDELIKTDQLNIYLCGGFYGDWNERVKEAIGGAANIIDPRDWKGITHYVQRDMEAIERCDVIFAYRQAENPAYGMVWELGYAAGLGDKHIIFLGEYNGSNEDRYFAFCRQSASYSAKSLKDAIQHLAETVLAYNVMKAGFTEDDISEETRYLDITD